MRQRHHDATMLERGLDVVARNTRVQVQLISDLLDVSRIVSGKLHLEIQPVDLASVIDQAIETVQHQAESKSVGIRRELARNVGLIAGDPARLEQVIWNLLSNAIKFTPSNGHVSVNLRSVDSRAEIIVQDSGAGIGPEVLPLIFDRFHQANSSTTRRFGGLGIGLAIGRHSWGSMARCGLKCGEGRGATYRFAAAGHSRRSVRSISSTKRPEDMECACVVAMFWCWSQT